MLKLKNTSENLFFLPTGVLWISYVFFGRASVDICPISSGTDSNCTLNNTHAQLQLDNAQRVCNNETSCSLKAGELHFSLRLYV